MCLQPGRQRITSHLVVKIFLTYETAFPILPSIKSKLLSVFMGTFAIASFVI